MQQLTNRVSSVVTRLIAEVLVPLDVCDVECVCVVAVSTAYIPTCSGTSSTLLPGVTDNELQLAALLEACSADQLNHNAAPPQTFFGLGPLDERAPPPPPPPVPGPQQPPPTAGSGPTQR